MLGTILGSVLGVVDVVAPAADVVAIYAATEDFETGDGETPENTIFPGTLLSPLRIERTLLSDLVGGAVSVSYGEAELAADPVYDTLAHDFDIAGRPVLIKVGVAGPYADFETVFDGTAKSWVPDDERFVVALRGWEFLLEVPFESRTYGGTGGLDGASDLEGKRIPVALAYVFNVTPVLLIEIECLFQVHGGAVHAIPAVYVRARAYSLSADYADADALRAAAIPAGQYATCLTLGLFRVCYLSDSEKGAVTCDVEGAVVNGVFLETTAQIVRHILVDRAAVPSTRISDAAGPWQFHVPAGYYAGSDDADQCADVVSKLVRGCAGWGGFSRRGVWQFGALRLPSADRPTVAYFDEADIISAAAVDLPETVSPPPWRWRVGYDRNWTVQTSDIAGIVTDERKAWLKDQRRLAEYANAETKAFYVKASDPDPIEGYFRDKADALRLATELEALWRRPRGLYRLEMREQALARDLDEQVNVDYPRWRLDGGALASIVAVSLDAEDGKSETTVLVA